MVSKEQIDAARGLVPCDVNFVNGSVADLFRGEIRKGVTVSVHKGFVVGVDDGLSARTEVDLGGRILVPGLVDSHVHIESSLLAPAEYATLVVPRGTTAVVADPHEIANVLGYDGMTYMLRASENLPLDVYIMAPSCVPATGFDTSGATLFASDMYPFLRDPRVLGLGEVMNFPGVLAKDPQLLDKIALFWDSGKAVDGHAPGLRGRDLSAYIAAGIRSDHECVRPEEALEKISKGMYVMIREGSATRDLAKLLPAVNRRTAARFLLCSDDRHATDLAEEGHIDRSIRLLVEGGIDPLDAIAMASLNAARYFGLRNSGAIAPGYKADFVAVSSLKDFRAEVVIKAGEVVAEDGQLVRAVESRPAMLRDSVNIKWLTADDFRIPAEGSRVRVIKAQAGTIITGELIAEPKVEGGLCVSDIERDILKAFVIERHNGSGNIGKGFITGLGLKRGAIGSTISHDSHNMILVGADDVSIFKAARHLNKIGGGMVISDGDRIILDLPLPIGGLMSDREAMWVVERMKAFSEHFRQEGLANESPMMTLSFMALPVIPKLKLTDRGLVDVERFSPVGLFVD
jgi:adenine deaminase